MILAPLPFIIELLADHILIRLKRKDLNIYVRAGMIIAVALVWLWITGDWRAALSVVVLACAPFAFFDPCLNLLRGEKWYYQSTTNGKWWDTKLAGMNHWAVLAGRIIIFVVLLVSVWLLR